MSEPRDIIVIGGSAGAIESLSKLVSHLPPQLHAAILVVIHTYPLGDSLLPAILTRRGSLTAAVATDGEPILCDRIYVAPPDRHMVLRDGQIGILVHRRVNDIVKSPRAGGAQKAGRQ